MSRSQRDGVPPGADASEQNHHGDTRNILTSLSPKSDYSMLRLQIIFGAWVLSALIERRKRISISNGHMSEEDYDKRSIYALIYSLFRSIGVVRSETGEPYEVTFNTWGYAWPVQWGQSPTASTDPQRFGKNAYTGLFEFALVKEYVRKHDGRVHVLEIGCGTGAGAHHVCENVLPRCTYEAVDMQLAAIQTCKRMFVPRLEGRLAARHADCAQMSVQEGAADLIAVCEMHITEIPGHVTEEDERCFRTAHRALKTGGFMVWGNAIPDSTWQPCFDYLESIGMRLIEVRDVTPFAIAARDEDKERVDAFVNQCIDRLLAFRIPVLGHKRGLEARRAMENFCRNPGTNLYQNMKDGTDTYRVGVLQKV